MDNQEFEKQLVLWSMNRTICRPIFVWKDDRNRLGNQTLIDLAVDDGLARMHRTKFDLSKS